MRILTFAWVVDVEPLQMYCSSMCPQKLFERSHARKIFLHTMEKQISYSNIFRGCTGHFQFISVPFQFDSTPIFNIDLILLGESQIQISKENVFIFYVGARVCPPLWLTNSDIRLLFAQLEWCGTKVTYKAAVVGAINHIGPGINHSIEDIFCHCCPLPITLHKKQPPSHTHTSFFSSIFPSATKETTDWSQEDGRMSLFPAILHAG